MCEEMGLALHGRAVVLDGALKERCMCETIYEGENMYVRDSEGERWSEESLPEAYELSSCAVRLIVVMRRCAVRVGVTIIARLIVLPALGIVLILLTLAGAVLLRVGVLMPALLSIALWVVALLLLLLIIAVLLLLIVPCLLMLVPLTIPDVLRLS